MAPIESPSLQGSDIWSKGKQSLRRKTVPKSALGGACKILEPSRKKLQSLESQRVMAVLEETVRRIEIIAVLSHVMKSISRFSVILGADLVVLLENHRKLQNEFNATVKYLKKAEELPTENNRPPKHTEDCTNNPESVKPSKQEVADPEEVQLVAHVKGSKRDALESEAALLHQRIKYSLRDIFRYFKKNPKAAEVVVGAYKPPVRIFKTGRKIRLAPVHRQFVDLMTALQEIMRERLLTTPIEKQDQKRYIAEVMAREKKTNLSREKLETRYKEALKDKEDEISKHDETMARLEHELSLLEKMTYDQQKRTVTESYKQCSVDKKASETRRASTNDDMISRKRKLWNDGLEHRETERVMRKRAYKMATEVYNWIQKFDADMDAKQDEFDIVEQLYDDEKQDLAELQRQLEILQTKFDAIMEERRLKAEKAAKRVEEERLMTIAATKMQALWRGYRIRKMLRGGKAKKGGKKNKKGRK